MNSIVAIGGKTVGAGHPPYVIAEVGNNHGGDPELARRMVSAAAACGVDAVKFQAYETARFLTVASTFFDEFEKERLGFKSLESLFELAESLGCHAFATPLDLVTLGKLVQGRRPALKIASGDISNFPLLQAAGKSGLPVILSTGASDLEDVENALKALGSGADRSILLHCTAQYPARDEDANLRAMQTLATRFARPVGLSDHTEGVDVALAAVALGAVMVEKHFTIDQSLPGGDNEMSLLPGDMERLVRGCRRIHAALGSPDKAPTREEADLKPLIRRSPAALKNIGAGEAFTEENLVLVRPGNGMAPDSYATLLGRTARRDIKAGDLIRREWVA